MSSRPLVVSWVCKREQTSRENSTSATRPLDWVSKENILLLNTYSQKSASQWLSKVGLSFINVGKSTGRCWEKCLGAYLAKKKIGDLECWQDAFFLIWVWPSPHLTVNNRGGAPQQGEERECASSKRNTQPKPEERISEEGTHVHENSKSSLQGLLDTFSLLRDKGMDPLLPGDPGSLSK